MNTVAGDGRARFAGDHGPAVNASMVTTRAVAFDKNGDLYIADRDNNRVRKVTTGGTITTVAGNGKAGYSGDMGQAINASLNVPSGLAVDSMGNLFIADQENHRIRKVSTNGTISTVAGTGIPGFSGDSGPATKAMLNVPVGLVVDSSGNLYIADQKNHRIREVTPNGIISTIAGQGRAIFGGDGGPAANASLSDPQAVAMDQAGSLYIADSGNNRIRKITRGVINTVAGNGHAAFDGDGGLATHAALNVPTGVAVDSTGRIYIADSGNDRIRVVLTTLPSIQVSTNRLSFSANSAGGAAAAQTVQLSSSLAGLPFSVPFSSSVKTSDGKPWLIATVTSRANPATVQVSADPGGLAPGSYTGVVNFSAVTAPSNLALKVSFKVSDPVAPSAQVQPSSLSVTLPPNSAAATQQLLVLNTGGGTLTFQAVPTTSSGGNWLTLSPKTGTATAAVAASLAVTADPQGLVPGTYSGQVSINAGAGAALCTVTMIVAASGQALVLSQTGLTFTSIPGGGAVPAQQFSVLNTGQGQMKWSITVPMGAQWLAVTPEGGVSDQADPQRIQVQVKPDGVAPGTYYGLLRVDAESADGSPQYLSVVLNAAQPGSITSPILVEPTGLIFTGTAGGTSPGSQQVTLNNISANPIAFGSGTATVDGANWVVNSPTTDSVIPSQPTQIVVQPNVAGLAAGVYRGAVTLVFDDGETSTIGLLLVLTEAEPASRTSTNAQAVCASKKLLPVFTSISEGFGVPASWPVGLTIQVVDNCGNALKAGSVTADFSNGDSPLSLVSLGDGRWSQTWVPQTVATNVAIKVTATSPQNISGTALATCGVQPNGNQPSLTRVSNTASLSPQAPLSPGALVTLVGTGLAKNAATSLPPLPTQLAKSSVELAGRLLPLQFASDKQINAQIPYDIPVNRHFPLLALPGAAVTTPIQLTFAAASPAIFTANQTGGGQGVIRDANGKLIQTGNAAGAGDLIVIACTGLGAVDPPVAAGVAAPLPPPVTVSPVQVTIGGVNAKVLFAGLVPGSVGLYQVKAYVPKGVPPGDTVNVQITVAGQVSPAVTMPIK